MRNIFFIVLLLCTSGANAARKMPEHVYQNMYCPPNLREVQLQDKTRVDCLTDKFAIEFDFADKWAEALGQSLHYARMTGRRPAIFLILESDSDMRYVNRLQPLCKKHGVWLTLIH